MVGGGSIDDFRRPANPPVYRIPKSQAGGGRLKDGGTTKPANDNSQGAGGGQLGPTKSTAKAGVSNKTLSRPPAPPATQAPVPLNQPVQTFENVEDAIEAGNNARDQKPADFRAAELAYKAATTLAPDDERGFIGLGNIYYDQLDFKQAVGAYRKAVELKPKNFSVLENLGNAYYVLGQYQEAIEASSQSIRLDPKPPGPYFTLAWANLAIGQGETAGNLANAFIYRWRPFYSEDPPYYVTFAGYLGYRDAGRPEEAKKLLAVAPDSSDCADLKWVCRLLKYFRHEITGEQLLKEANDVGRKTEAQTYIGVDLALSGKREEALPYLRWVVTNGDRTFSEYGLASVWLKKLENP
jgi:tetratricopeptide (TPR) repeat protein